MNGRADAKDAEPQALGEVLRVKSASGFHPGNVYRHGSVVIKDAHPWTPTVHTLLRHLEAVGFDGAPRLVGTGFDGEGHETLTYVEGEFTQPGPWTLEGAASTGHLLRRLHDAAASYRPPPDAVWQPLVIRTLGSARKIISHCDLAPRFSHAQRLQLAEIMHWADTVVEHEAANAQPGQPKPAAGSP
jgi:hypothetical protein